MTIKKISASMRERKRMAFALSVKSIDTEGRFAGYASVFDIVDNQRDIIAKGAFTRTISQQGAGAVKMLWQHQQDEPIGIFERMFEDAYGLYVEGRLLLSVQKAKEAHDLLKAGALSGLSIGYFPVRYKIDAETGVRQLLEVELFEVSLVTFPANTASKVTVVKSTPAPAGGGLGRGHYWHNRSKHAFHLTSPLLGEGNPDLVALSQTLDKAILTLRT